MNAVNHAMANSLQVVAPFDLAVLGEVPLAGPEQVEAALAQASALHRDRARWLAPDARIAILRKAADLLQSRAESFAVAAAREGGKPLVDSRVEVVRAIDGLRNCAEVLRSEPGHVVPMNITGGSKGRYAFTQRFPIGVVVAVSAFNHPLNLIVHQVGPAIAAGCPVIVKPARDVPLTCIAFVELLREAGLPAEWAQVLVTDTHDTLEALVTDPRVAFFSFIGGPRVGWKMRSRLAPGTRCALEHGGAAPAIVTEHADLALAASAIAKGGFYHAGQVCVSVQRVFVHASLSDRFVAMLADLAGQMVVGDPTDARTEVGPLIRPAEVKRLGEWVAEAVEGGAKLVCGGNSLPNHCFEPTVLLNPAPDARVSRQEVFGPVVCVYTYEQFEEAVAQANAVDFSFQAAVFTERIDEALAAFDALDGSAVMVNDHSAFRTDWMPFAGLRQSGLGVGGIPHTYRDMTVEKMMVLRKP